MAPPGSRPRPGRQWVEAVREFILSPPFQAAVQLSVGTFLAGLFVFVRPISFPLACLASLLLVVVVAVLSPDNHIGTRFMGAATLLGGMAWGLVLGGAALTLVHVAVRPHCSTHVGCSAHTAMLCCISVALVLALCVTRAALGPPYPPHVWVAGMVVTLSYGLVLIAGQFTTDLHLLWTNVVGGLLLSCLVAAGLSSAVSLLVLPSLATDEMRADAAATIRGIGHAASRFASRGLQREDSGAAPHVPHLHPRPHLPALSRVPLPAQGGGGVLVAPLEPQGVAGQHAPTPPATAAAAQAQGPQSPQDYLQADGYEGEPASLPSDSGYSHGCQADSYTSGAERRTNPLADPNGSAAPHGAAANAGATASLFPAAADASPAAAALPASPRSRPRSSGVLASLSLDPWDSAASTLTRAAATITVAIGDDRTGYAGGNGGSFSQPTSAPTSDDERPAWPLHPMPRPRGYGGSGGGQAYGDGFSGGASEFEHVMEDEDAFLRLLQEATAPQVPYGAARGGSDMGRRLGRRRGGGARAARATSLPVTAPPGGILPSPSTRDLMGLGGAASVTALSAPTLPGVAEAAGTRLRARGKQTGAHATSVAAEGDHGQGEAAAGASGPPGSGGAMAHSGGGLASSAVPWAPVSALRPLLARARACCVAAAVEPPWMIRGPADLGRWSRVLSAAETLLNRVAALECLMEDHRPGQPAHSLGDVSLAAVLGVDVISSYRCVYGKVAARCAAMSVAMVASMEGRSGSSAFGAVGGWQEVRKQLRSLVRTAMSTYWARVRAVHRHGEMPGQAAATAESPRAGQYHSTEIGADAGGRAAPSSSEAPSSDAPRPDGVNPKDHHERRPPTHGSFHVRLHHHIRLKLNVHQDSQQQQQSGNQNDLYKQQQHHHHHHHHPHLRQHHHHHAGRHHLRPAKKIPTISLHQGRALTFLWTVTEGVIFAVDELEAAVQHALTPAQTRCGRAARAAANAASPALPSPLSSDSTVTSGSSPASGSSGRTPSEVVAGVDASESGGGSVVLSIEGPAPPPRPGGQRLHRQPLHGWLQSWAAALVALGGELCRWGWVRPLLEITLGLPMLRHTASLLASHTSTLLLQPLLTRGSAAASAARASLLRSRLFRFYLKYWAVSLGALCFILGLAARPDAPFMRHYPMLYAYLAATVSMTDRVESTLSKSALRAGGTLAGGLLGLWVMLLHDWANSPVGLLAAVALVAFLTGCLATHRLLYGAYLTVGTLLSIVFCQYGTTPYCCSTPGGTLEMFAARVVSVLLGCTLPVLFSQAVLPWYTSDWGLEIMAAAFQSSAKIVQQLYETFYDEHLRAHVSSCGVVATAALLRQYGMEAEAEELLAREGAEGLEAGPALEEATTQEGAKKEAQRAAQQTQLPPCLGSGDGRDGGSPTSLPGAENSGGGGSSGVTAAASDEQQPDVAVVVSSETKGDGGGDAAAAAAAAAAQATSTDAAAAAVAAATAARKSKTAADLRTQVSGPLVAVQTSLMKDTAVWSRGIYATPPIVPALLRCGLLLADRLAALQLVVSDTPPPVHGKLSGWAFERMVMPLHREMLAVMSSLDHLSAATAQLLLYANTAAAAAAATADEERRSSSSVVAAARTPTTGQEKAGEKAKEAALESPKMAGPDSGVKKVPEGEPRLRESPAAAAVRAAVHDMHMCRLQIRQHIHDMRRAFHADVRSLDEQRLSYATHPDDTVHVNSMLYALVKTLDKATALARTALEHRWDLQPAGRQSMLLGLRRLLGP